MHLQMHFDVHQLSKLELNSISFFFFFLSSTIPAVGKLYQSCDRRDRAKMRHAPASSVEEKNNAISSGKGRKSGRGRREDNEKTKERESWEDRRTKTSSARPGIFALSSRARVLITGTRGVIFSPSPILASPLPPSFSGLVLAAFPPPLSFSPRCRIVRMRQAALIHHGTRRRMDDRIVAKFATYHYGWWYIYFGIDPSKLYVVSWKDRDREWKKKKCMCV